MRNLAVILGGAMWVLSGCSSEGTTSGVDAGADAGAMDGGGVDAGPGGGDASTEDSGAPEDIDAGPDGSSSEVTFDVDAFCTTLRDTTCEWIQECRPQFEQDCGNWWGVRQAEDSCAALRADLDAGRATLDEERAQACADANASVSPTCAFPAITGMPGRAQDVCADLVIGTLAEDADCWGEGGVIGDACGDGLYCRFVAQCPGSCTPYVELGETCGADERRCAPDAFCNGEQRCEARVAAGAACESRGECPRGTTCLSDGEDSLCLARVGEGEACHDGFNNCEIPLACSGGSCGTEALTGGRCSTNDNCPDGDVCMGDPTVCVTEPGEGDDCVESHCAAGLQCDFSDDTCVPLRVAGESCDDLSCAEGHYCTNDGDGYDCVAYHAEDESCLAPGPTRGLVRFCQDGLACVVAGTDGEGRVNDKRCKPAPTAEGDACGPDYPARCPEGLFCSRPDFTCQPPRALGEACDAGNALGSCQDGLFCGCAGEPCETYEPDGPPAANEVCAAQKANDSPCTNGLECASDYCADTCQDAPIAADRCTVPD